MKALFVLILAIVAGFAGYRFAYDELVKVVDLSIPVEKPAETPAPVVAEVAPVAPKPVVVAPKVVAAPTPPPPMDAPKIAITGGLGMTEATRGCYPDEVVTQRGRHALCLAQALPLLMVARLPFPVVIPCWVSARAGSVRR